MEAVGSTVCRIVQKSEASQGFWFRDQITRSGLSIPSNIAEGMTRLTDKDKVHFLIIARSSCAELRTQIYIGIDIEYINAELDKQWLEETREISAMINGLITSINKMP